MSRNEQSHRNSFVNEEGVKKISINDYKTGSKSHVNGKSVLIVARCLIKEPLSSHQCLQESTGVKSTSVTYALKKIKDKIINNQILPGLSENEMESLTKAMTKRAEDGGRWGSNGSYSQLKTEAISMANTGQSVAGIALSLGIDPKKVLTIIGNKTKENLAQKMFFNGRKIPFIAEHLQVNESVVEKMLSKNESLMSAIAANLIDKKNNLNNIISETGFNKKNLINALRKTGHSLKIIAKEMSKNKEAHWNIARRLGITENDAKKILNIKTKNFKIKATGGILNPEKRISMIAPSKPNSSRNSKKPASISPKGLAAWNVSHYDPITGELNLSYYDPETREMKSLAAPADLPKRFPKTKIALVPMLDRQQELFAAPMPSKSECSARGRQKIGIMHLY